MQRRRYAEGERGDAMKTYYPLGKDSEDTEERPRTRSVTDDDLKGIHCSTRQIWAQQDGEQEHKAWNKSWQEKHPEWYPDKDGKPWDVYWAEYWSKIKKEK